MCPSSIPVIPTAPFPPVGPLGRVPHPPRYSGAAPTPRRESCCPSLPSAAVLLSCSAFVSPQAPSTWPVSQGMVSSDPDQVFREDTVGPPRFLGFPHTYMPCSVTPVGPRHLASRCLDAVFADLDELDSHVVGSFRGSIARPAHSLSTLRRMGCPIATQDSLPAGCPSVAGQDCGPAGNHGQVSARCHRASPSPKLSWRTKIRPQVLFAACSLIFLSSLPVLLDLVRE